jgi:hypothetical protein
MTPEAARSVLTELEMADNLNTAKALGLTVPSRLAAIAEEVIKNRWSM